MENLTAMADTDRVHRSVVRSRDAVNRRRSVGATVCPDVFGSCRVVSINTPWKSTRGAGIDAEDHRIGFEKSWQQSSRLIFTACSCSKPLESPSSADRREGGPDGTAPDASPPYKYPPTSSRPFSHTSCKFNFFAAESSECRLDAQHAKQPQPQPQPQRLTPLLQMQLMRRMPVL